ncbi:MAG: PmoA family protein [Verrucomicrobiota bacterium]|nr:PmoA family protein [Verrucomicrobiota bacterium]
MIPTRSSHRGPDHAALLLTSCLLTLCLGPAHHLTAGPPVVIQPNRVLIQTPDQGKATMTYVFPEDAVKPYVLELRTPSGLNILRDAPDDHPHHHGVMFGVGADEDVDFWAETEGCGRQLHQTIRSTFQKTQGALSENGFTSTLHWCPAESDQPLIVENRTIALREAKPTEPTLLTWVSQLQPGSDQEKTRLWGSHYFGLGLRFQKAMDADGTHFNRSGITGENVRGDEYVVPVPWSAYHANLDNNPVTVALFDHPSNPRHPAGIFIMSTPFAYQAATLNLWKETMDLTAAAPLRLVYGVAVWDGHPNAEVIEQTYQSWAAAQQ